MGKNREFYRKDLWKWLCILPESGQKSLGQAFSEMFLSTSFRAAEPKILSKKKKLPYRVCFKGALSLAERTLFVNQSPGLFHKFTPAERTACKRFGSCEKE